MSPLLILNLWVRNSTSAEKTAEIFRCRLISSYDFTDEMIFRPSVVHPQIEGRDDRCWLWISTNSIVSIHTASSKSTKKFGRCRVYSYFQYILLNVIRYTHPMNDMIPMILSWDMHESILWRIWFLWYNSENSIECESQYIDSYDY